MSRRWSLRRTARRLRFLIATSFICTRRSSTRSATASPRCLKTQRSHILLGVHPFTFRTHQFAGEDRGRAGPGASRGRRLHSIARPSVSLCGQAGQCTAMQPARIKAGAGHMDFSVNRREKLADGRVVLGLNETGPADHAVGVVRVDSQEGRPLAALVNYTCHPIFVGSASRLISPDYPGPMRRVVERETGATCLFLQGATGNVNPRSPMHPGRHGGRARRRRCWGWRPPRCSWMSTRAPPSRATTGSLRWPRFTWFGRRPWTREDQTA